MIDRHRFTAVPRTRPLIFVAVVTLMVAVTVITACGPTDYLPASVSADSSTTSAMSHGIAWFEGSVESALISANTLRKPVFLYWGAGWCPYCKQVEATVFTRQDVIDRTRQFVAVYLDGDAPAAQQVGESFAVRGYPTMIVLNADGEELTRIPNGLNVEVYAEIFDRALEAQAPISSVVAKVLASGGATPTEFERLGYYSWGQDNARVLNGDNDSETFAALADACGDPEALACSRLYLLSLDSALSDHDETPQDSLFVSAEEQTTVQQRVSAILSTPRLLRANLDTVLLNGPEIVLAITDIDSTSRRQLTNRWLDVLAELTDDTSLPRVERLYASYGPIGFLQMEDEDAAVPTRMQSEVQAFVTKASVEVSDPIERHAVISTAGSLLRAADLPEAASALLESELENSKQPYYFMSALASTAEKEGDTEAAIDWRRRAYAESKGEATRFRWGYGYVAGLLRMAPDDIERIETTTQGLFAELEDPQSALFGGTQSRAEQLSSKLLAWAETGERQAAVARIRYQVLSLCATIPGDDVARQRCESFLQPAGADT